MKASKQYFPVVLFIMLYKVVLTFESVDEILKCDHSKESNLAALSSGTTFLAYKVVLTFASVDLSFESVDWSNPELRPCIQIKPVDENNENFFSFTYRMTENGAFPLLAWCCLYVFVFNFNVLFVFFIIAIGDPKPIIAWRKDGKVLRNSQKYSVRRNGALIITHAQYNDSGRYECVARTNWEQADGFTNLMIKGRREERKKWKETLLFDISKIQLVVYYQCCVLIGWATTRLYVVAD